MTVFWRWAALAAVAPGLGGCAIGGMAAIGPTPAAPPPAAPAAIVYGPFLDGPVGQKLSQADRDMALAAEQDAVVSGQKKTWRGAHGTFGFVEPTTAVGAPHPQAVAGDGVPAEVCRDFTSTVFIGGRPQVGRGRGCTNPDGSGAIVG